MMGHSHAAAGLAAGMICAPWTGVTGPAAVTAWVVAVGGFALLSDVDTVNSSASRMWGPLSQVLFRPIAMARSKSVLTATNSLMSANSVGKSPTSAYLSTD